ncbi:MAG: hypothetical protein JSU86_01260 [Phycisphaerales bacterium]|nr:MAG: hypothetical protein JSU86_01260 [Phycisphaerales bacterium]
MTIAIRAPYRRRTCGCEAGGGRAFGRSPGLVTTPGLWDITRVLSGQSGL